MRWRNPGYLLANHPPLSLSLSKAMRFPIPQNENTGQRLALPGVFNSLKPARADQTPKPPDTEID